MHPVTSLVRKLRKQSTPAETLFWEAVRNKKTGMKIKRQHPIMFDDGNQKRLFIADFYWPSEKLVIEIDGKTHDNQKEYDELRTMIINELGMKVVRITNEEIEADIQKAIENIFAHSSE